MILFIAGLYVGFILGIFALGVCASAGQSDTEIRCEKGDTHGHE